MTGSDTLQILPDRPSRLLALLAGQGISVTLADDALKLTAPKGALTPALRDHISALKPEVLDYLRAQDRVRARIMPAQTRPGRLPLSFAQQRLWFLDQLTGGGPTYNISSAIEIAGPLQHAAMQAALNALVARHAVLRTTFAADQGVPFQVIAERAHLSVPMVDLSSLSGPARDSAVQDALAACLSDRFDLTRDLMLKATLIRLEQDRWYLILLLHHIAGDGWSIGVLTEELAQLYQQMVDGRPADLPPLPIDYADFAIWQRGVLAGPVLESQLDYWRDQLRDAPLLLRLPSDRPRPDRQSFAGAHADFVLSEALTQRLHGLARRLGTTLYSVLMAGFAALLYRYSGQDDVVIGTPIANRNRRELEPLVGFFVNTLALRLNGLTDDLPFAALVRQHSTTARSAFDHQDLPFERLVEDLAPERDQSHAPIFQTAFALQNAPRGALTLAGLTLRPVPLDNRTAKFDIFLSVEEHGGHLRCTWEYATDLFDASTIARMADHFERLLDGAATDPDTGLGHLPLLSQAEVDHQLSVLNRPFDPPETLRSLPDLFRDLAARLPEAPALEFRGKTLGYAALDRAADAVAARLVAAGLHRQGAVGILLPRGFDMIVAMLGILKAGGAFVPLDPAYPVDRLAYIAGDCGMRFVLSDTATRDRLPAGDFTLLLMEVPDGASDPLVPALSHAPDDLAYLIYTSGSTGRPKGAMNSHAGLANLAQIVRELFGAGPGSRALHFASFSFDSSVWEILIPLVSGGTLCLIPEEMRLPDRAFADWLRDTRISHATFTPSFLAALPPASLPDLRDLVLAGEACPPALLRVWGEGRRIINAYGPSEATVCATFAVLSADAPVTIGRPAPNVQVHVLRGDALLPFGAEGELVIGGLGVGLGYRGRPDLTAAAFAPNPFGPGRIYRTGDKVRYLAGGDIQYLGRIDHQTKLRGHRIDPAEIEAVLSDDPMVQAAVVLPREDRPGERRLVAYVQPHPLGEAGALERTREWQGLFDTVYATDRQADDPEFDITGWTSSYDGSDLPAADMRDWLEDTLAVIRARNPVRVLEIGCGSGLILSRIAPEVSVYDATDISAAAVARIEALCARTPALRHVRAIHSDANDFSTLAGAGFDSGTGAGYDLIVLNSVVQYFPSLAYLRRVLAGLSRRLAPGGAIFLGDIRDLRLAGALHADVQAFRAPPTRRAGDVASMAAQAARDDEELYLDPAAFVDLAEELPDIAAVQVFLKGGRVHNELTMFRYQVLLDRRPAGPAPVVVEGAGLDLAGVLSHLPDQDAVLVTGLLDARIATAVARWRWMQQCPDQAVGSWTPPPGPAAIDPADLIAAARQRGLAARILPDQTPGVIQALIYRGPTVPQVRRPGAVAVTASNSPLQGKFRRLLVTGLRARLRAALPDYMMPAAFVVLDRLPLTPHGKIDRRALPPPESVSAVTTQPPAAPQSRAEIALAAIWCAVLRLDAVGLNDNFFEIGGDSISSVQVVAKARDIGLALTAQDIFKHQTIAGLARAARVGDRAQVSQDRASGTAPATPIQLWFAERIAPAPHHFNQSILVTLAPDCPAGLVAAALAALHDRHDALTARFAQGAQGWQMHFGQAAAPELQVIDCCDPDLIKAACARAQASLDPAAGRMSCPIFFRRGDDAPLLFWTVHHLGVDVVSWHILQADFVRACIQLRDGPWGDPQDATQKVDLGPRPLSFADWARGIDAASDSWAVRRHLAHWQTVAEVPPLRLQVTGPGPDTAGLTRTVRRALPAALSDALLTSANAAYGTRPVELILASLGAALVGFGSDAFRIDVETQGRDGERDLSGTVGWFTALVPMVLRAGPFDQTIPALKDAFRTTLAAAQSHGQLLYQARAGGMQTAPAQVVFNHLGQVGGAQAPGWPFAGPCPLDAGPIHAPDQTRPYALQITTGFEADGLSLSLTHGSACIAAATMDALADRVVQALADLVAHCRSIPARIATPGDYPLASLTADELAGLPHGPEIEDILDATPLQEGMLFECLSAPDAGQYIEQVGFDLSGPLDAEAMERAWNALIARHGILRSGFALEGQSRARQIMHRAAELRLVRSDLRDLTPEAAAQRLTQIRTRDRQLGFDFAKPPLMRLHLLHLGQDRWHLLWTSHHILMDGWCIKTIFTELRALYAAERAGQADPLMPPPDWRDYLRFRQTADPGKDEAWWRGHLSELQETTRLCGPALSAPRQCDHLRLTLAPDATAMLQAMARAHQVTLNTLLQGAWSALLAHATGKDDVLHGTTINGRPPGLPGSEDMVGLFINTLPHRARMHWDQPIADWLRGRHADMAALDAHGLVSLRDLRGWCDVPRSEGALFDTLFVFENFPFDDDLARHPLADDLRLLGIDAGGETNFPLTVVASLRGQTLTLRLTHDRAALDGPRAAVLAQAYRTLLEGLTANLSRPLRDWLPCVLPVERPRSRPPAALLPDLLAQRLALSPTDPVLTDGHQTLTVADLVTRATGLAGALAAAGHPAQAPVALILDRGVDFVVGLLAAWQRHAPFVPVDPKWPAARKAQVLALAGADHAIGAPLPDCQVKVLPPDASASAVPLAQVAADDLAYVIFTSGSTGTPKGVRISHGNLAAYVAGITERLALAPGMTFATTSGFAADLGYTALMPALALGCLSLLSEELVTDPDALGRHLEARPVDVLKTVPGHFVALLTGRMDNALLPRKALVFGGDRLEAALVRRIRDRAPGLAVFNHYGPTETTIGAVCGLADPAEGCGVPLGKALPGVDVTICGPAGHRLPPGLAGEIVIQGATVSPGYLGGASGGFGPEPGGAALQYRTGDLGLFDDLGRLHFIGRRDGQAKIRGFRIEPAEVASVLGRHPSVTSCHVAIGQKPDGGAQLLAWVCGPTEGAAQGLCDWVRDHLPDAFVPSRVILLPALPRLANGKIDTRALPQPQPQPSDRPVPAADRPAGPVGDLCRIFAAVLRRAEVRPDDNFFDLGGDSIVAIQVVARARDAGLRLTTRDVFAHQSPAELALCARALADVPAAEAQPSGPFAPGPVQARFLRGHSPEPWHYNQSLLFAAPTGDAAILTDALAAVIAQHDMLRLRFADGRLRLDDAPAALRVGVETIDLSDIPPADQAAVFAPHAARLQASLDLTAGPILRVALILRGGGQGPLVLWVIHHLAVDAVSWRILLDDLATACQHLMQGHPPKLPGRTMGFPAWTAYLAHTDRFDGERAHWRQAAAIFTDLPGQAASDRVADLRRSEAALTVSQTAALSAQSQKTPLLDLIVTALMRALRSQTGHHDLRIDLEGHGRDVPDADIDISRTVGWFTALHPLRVSFPRRATDDRAEDLAVVRAALAQVPNGGIGYGVLREMAADAALRTVPDAAIVLNYLGRLGAGGTDHGLKAGPARSPAMIRPYPVEVVAMLMDDRLHLLIEHSPLRYSPAMIDGLRDLVLAELGQLAQAAGESVATPQDFGLSGLNADDFARLQDLLGDPGDG